MRVHLRSATLHGYIPLASDLGLDPARMTAKVGLDLDDLQAPDRWIPAAMAAQLLDVSASGSGCEDFALRLATYRRLATLGPISVALREETTLRSVLTMLIRHEQSFNEALRMHLDEGDGVATIRITLDFGEPAPAPQAQVLGVAALNGIIRDCVGAQWQPVAAYFPFREPGVVTPYETAFGPGLRFQQGYAGLAVSSDDLDAPNPLADPLLQPYAGQFLEWALWGPEPPGSHAQPTVTAVSEIVEQLLPLGRCSMTRAARVLDMDPRTLRRHLAREGSSFSAIVNQTRRRLARRHLLGARLSMTDIAHSLGFEAPSGFSRWFRQEFGVTPREWQASRSSR